MITRRGCSRSPEKFIEINSLVPAAVVCRVAATEQEMTNTAAHGVAGAHNLDLGSREMLIFLFRDKEIVLSSS